MSECEACSSVVVNDVDVVMAQRRTRCTHREKRLTVTLILLSILSFGLLAFIIVSGPLASLISPQSKNDGLEFLGVCDTKECVEVSYRAIHSGNFSSEPCQDFYKFACSQWQENNPVTNEQLYTAVNINQIRDGVDLHIKKLLEVPNSDKDNEYSAPNSFYRSCLNFTSPNESFILGELLDSLGGYKTSETWSESQFDLTTIILQFLQVNSAPLFDLTLDIDARNRSRYALIVELPRPTSLVPNLFRSVRNDDDDLLFMESTLNTYSGNLLLRDSDLDVHNNKQGNNESSTSHSPSFQATATVERHHLYKMITDNVEAKKMDQLKDLVQKIGRLMDVSEETMNTDSTDIVIVATSIEKLKPSQRSRKFLKQRNKVYNTYTVDTLQAHFNGIDWKFLLQSLMRVNTSTAAINPEYWSEAAIYVPYPDYLRRLFQAIQSTNKRLLYNTMLLIYVRDVLSDLIQRKKDESRWKFCVQSTKSVFAMELSSLYLRSFELTYLQRVRTEIDEIFTNVKESLLRFLNRSTWLEKLSKDEAIRKIETLKGNFIAPSFYFREDYLDEALKSIRIDPMDFLSNVRLVYRTFREQLYRLYWTQVDEDRATWAFVSFPTTVNAFYIQQFNSIVVPLAILNPPHYTKGAPKYINYATTALTIAHEALHALDSSGSDFDADGKLHDWWNGEKRGFLQKKSSCVAKQYSDNFKKIVSFYQAHVAIQVDGNLTQNENLADIAGLQVAFNAYVNYRRRLSLDAQQSERKLPGLNYSLEQIYFLSVAQAYCANISPMGYIFLLEVDEHTPHPERINGMLMNIPEFSKAFKCPLGSNMNPHQKCLLWT